MVYVGTGKVEMFRPSGKLGFGSPRRLSSL